MCEVQCGYQAGAKFWEVHSWLKSLRLHKYSDLFSRMTYDQMMSLTEEQLEAQGVTKGARHKIILNINKLKNRVNNLKALIQSLDEEGCNFIRQALNELKTILNTPIKPYVNNSLGSTASPDSSPRCDCEDNIENSPSYQCDCFGSSSDAHELLINHIIKVIEKIGSLFIYTQYVDDECLKMFNVCIDKCLSHEAFSGPHKQRLCFWKQQTDSLRYSFPGRRSMGHRQLKGKWGNPKQPNEFNNGNNMNYNQSNYINGNISSVTGFLHCNKSALNASNSNVNNSRRTRPMGQTNLTQPNFRFICNYNHSLGFPGMERSMNSSFINQGFNEHLKYIPSNLSNDGLVLNNIPGSPINRSSQINNSGQLMNNVLSGKESDSINTYIEKLCLRMTEQALGGGMDEDMDF